MSLAENYEKTALGVAGFAVVAAGAMIFLSRGAIEEDFESVPPGNANAAGAPLHAKAKDTIASMEGTKELPSVDINNRRVDTFVGLPIFVRKGQEDTAIDILSPSSEPVHPPIPNTWWVEHRIDLGFDNSPELDEDGDGFTNLEEFEAGTNPSRATDYPALINKVRVARVEKDNFLLEFTRFGDADAQFRVTWLENGRQERLNTATLKPGDTFPAEGKFANAFRYEGREEQEFVNPRNNLATNIWVAQVTDQRENLKGREMDVLARRAPGNVARKGYLGADRYAVLTLEAIGNEGKEKTIAEGESFSLPFGADEKPYTITAIDDADQVTITGPGADEPLVLQP